MRLRTSPPLAAMLGLGLLAGLGGCGALEAFDVRRPTADIAAVRLRDLGLQSATLEFDVDVQNNFSAPLQLVDLDYSLARAGRTGQPFLSGKADVHGSVAPYGKKRLSLPVSVSYADLLAALKDVRPGAVIPYVAEMGLSVNVPSAGPLRLPLRRRGSLPVPAAPEVSIAEIAWQEVGLDQAKGVASFNVVNRNEFPVDLAKLQYALSLGGVQVAEGSVTKALSLAAKGGAGVLEVPIAFSPRQAGAAVLSVLLGERADYSLRGELGIDTPFGPATLPVEQAGEALLRR